MTTIDQRILIPTTQTVVWAYISNVTNNPEWQADCQNVAFLTSKRDGPDTRWRYSTERGREYVVEITAWYNGLGYEYIFIDGPPYRNNRGRIRLQEIAEGTIVQWTFSYEMGGMLAGIRGSRRHLENDMANSLKSLYRKIKQFAADGNVETKALMRDAPDVEARKNYRPRHPVSVKPNDSPQPPTPKELPVTFAEPPIFEGDGQPITRIELEEPPVSVEDTRPRPIVTGFERPAADVPAANETDFEPDFLDDAALSEPAADVFDTQPRPGIPAEPEAVHPEIEPEFVVEDSFSASPESLTDSEEFGTVPDSLEAFKPPVEPTKATAEHVVLEDQPTVPTVSQPIASETENATVVSEALRDADTPSASIWDVFGVPRPSTAFESTTIGPAIEEPVPAAAEPEAPVVEEADPRYGFRIRLRRKLTRLRRPM
jgi:hypothetical protein